MPKVSLYAAKAKAVSAAEPIAKPSRLLQSYFQQPNLSVLCRTSLGSSDLQRFPQHCLILDRMHQLTVEFRCESIPTVQ